MIVHSHQYPTPPPAANLFAGYELIETPFGQGMLSVHQTLVQKRLNELQERKEMILALTATTTLSTTDYLTTLTFFVCANATEYPL